MKKGKPKEEGRKRKEKKPPGKPGPQPSSFSLSPFTFDEVIDIALDTKMTTESTKDRISKIPEEIDS